MPEVDLQSKVWTSALSHHLQKTTKKKMTTSEASVTMLKLCIASREYLNNMSCILVDGCARETELKIDHLLVYQVLAAI